MFIRIQGLLLPLVNLVLDSLDIPICCVTTSLSFSLGKSRSFSKNVFLLVVTVYIWSLEEKMVMLNSCYFIETFYPPSLSQASALPCVYHLGNRNMFSLVSDRCLVWNSGFSTYFLRDLGQVSQLLCASVSSIPVCKIG